MNKWADNKEQMQTPPSSCDKKRENNRNEGNKKWIRMKTKTIKSNSFFEGNNKKKIIELPLIISMNRKQMISNANRRK